MFGSLQEIKLTQHTIEQRFQSGLHNHYSGFEGWNLPDENIFRDDGYSGSYSSIARVWIVLRDQAAANAFRVVIG